MLATTASCKRSNCTIETETSANAPQCIAPQPSADAVYESWHSDNHLLHTYFGGLHFDPGAPEGAKYIERNDVSPWLKPEFITPEIASADKMPWAENRYLRWLAAQSTTVHFPFFPDDWPDDLFVEVTLRPKNNPSMAVRFYKPDGNGGRVWSDPLTTDLTPGYYGYRWKVPKEYLSKDGMQLMRFSFPGTFFEGDSRVSAKFVNIGFGPSDQPAGRFTVAPANNQTESADARVLDQKLPSYRLHTGDVLERFMVVPDNASLRFYAAPAAFLETPGKLTVELSTDTENAQFDTHMLAELQLTPGDCWQLQEIDISEYAQQAVRFRIHFDADPSEQIFKTTTRHAEAYLSSPEIVVSDAEPLAKAHETMASAHRIIVLAIDNLRADRLRIEAKRRATPVLSHMADEGILGTVMGEGISHVAMTTSFLTSVPAYVHKVYSVGTHVRENMTSIAEAAKPKGWKSYFYSTSGIIDSTRGFAQGFDEVNQLNKEDRTDTRQALEAVASAIAASPENSLFYVHLSELRLPHRISDEKLELWGVPGYNGPIEPAAMQNIAVMRDPGPLDARQFEAYYDGELSEIDEAIGEFLNRIGDDNLVVVFGTHGNSLGESTLGYEQGLTPWELFTPFVFYMTGHSFGIRREGLTTASELSVSILDLIGADLPANSKTIFDYHNAQPYAQHDGVSATASMRDFYRIRREGVDALFSTGLDGNPARSDEEPKPITRQALREQIE